jgi:hypothetical protein
LIAVAGCVAFWMAHLIVTFRFASALPHWFSIETRKAIATLRCAVSFFPLNDSSDPANL